MELRVQGAGKEVFWLMDGKLIARTKSGEGYSHRFTEPGEHTLTALDEQGAYDSVNVTVFSLSSNSSVKECTRLTECPSTTGKLRKQPVSK